MSGHVSNTETEFTSGFQVANRAEQTRYSIEVLFELERDHVAAMEHDIRVFLLGESQHLRAEI